MRGVTRGRRCSTPIRQARYHLVTSPLLVECRIPFVGNHFRNLIDIRDRGIVAHLRAADRDIRDLDAGCSAQPPSTARTQCSQVMPSMVRCSAFMISESVGWRLVDWDKRSPRSCSVVPWLLTAHGGVVPDASLASCANTALSIEEARCINIPA